MNRVFPAGVDERRLDRYIGGEIIDYDELSHHPHVLMFEDMAVEHVRHARIGLDRELHDEPHDLFWTHDDRVAALEDRRLRPIA
jgi:hypothetical protein